MSCHSSQLKLHLVLEVNFNLRSPSLISSSIELLIFNRNHLSLLIFRSTWLGCILSSCTSYLSLFWLFSIFSSTKKSGERLKSAPALQGKTLFYFCINQLECQLKFRNSHLISYETVERHLITGSHRNNSKCHNINN